MTPYISIVIPVYNEEGNLGNLFDRLYPVMLGFGRPFEIISELLISSPAFQTKYFTKTY